MSQLPPGNDVLAALTSIDPRSRDALVVLALDQELRLSRTRWSKRAADAGIKDDRGRLLQGPAFQEIVDGLVARGAVLRDEYNEHILAGEWLVPVLEDAHRRSRLVDLARGMRGGDRWSYSNGLGVRGDLLFGLASGDQTALERARARFGFLRTEPGSAYHPLVDMLGLHAPLSWIARLEPPHALSYLRGAVDVAFTNARPLGAGVRDAALALNDEDIRAQVAMSFSLAGNVERAHAVLDGNGTAQWTRGARAFAALTEGKHSEARELFRAAAVGSRGQRVDLPSHLAVFDVLLAVTSDRADEVADVTRRMHKGRRFFAHFMLATLALEDLHRFRTSGAKPVLPRQPPASWIDDVVAMLHGAWTTTGARTSRASELARLASAYPWLAGEMERIAHRDPASLFGLFGNKEPWQLALETLHSAIVEDVPGNAAGRTKTKRKPKNDELWWTVTVHPESQWVDVDSAMASGLSVKGTKIAHRRVLEDAELVVTDHDRRIAERLVTMRERGEYLLPCSALITMIGHPRVRDTLGRQLRVETGEPKLRVDRTAKGARIVLVPALFDNSGTAVEREDDRLVVYTRTPVVARVAAAVPPTGIDVPREGLARMNELLGAVGASIGIEMGETLARDDAEAQADPRLHVQLFRAGTSMRVRLRVLPATSGPALRPGVPPAETVVHRDGELVRIVRDLAGEQARLDALLDRCPTLASLPREGDDLLARDLETCLELLLELREAETDAVVEWLEGQPLRVPAARSGAHLHLRVKGDSAWLSVEGEMHIDEERVVGMSELLECASRARGRFVPIGEDEWVALTADLRKRLDALGRVDQLGKNGRVSTALLSAMDGIFEGLDVSFADEVAKKRDALERARDLDVRTPRGLEAELRDYQRDGFVFLARRAEAGLGACLADDMGLGKTVQALALLLHRSKKGPALVVAPTSVCRNWEDEARRFAPSLDVHRFGDGGRQEREAVVRDAKRGDVVIVSYGLLASDALLATREWSTVIFDEAHALKNSSTRRWSAAQALPADAIVALTGTPVENHAGELHALFDLLVPGMLGTRLTFDRALGSAIADGSREAAALLRQIVRPFVLRRTKAQVLSELPPKTEVLHVVSASKEHLAFYEAVRRRAVEKIEAAKKAGGASASRARIDLLAEITRLRRAAIDPRLVGGEGAPVGAKLDTLAELVSELRAEGRRALVFSQFLEVLDYARAKLEERGVECLRLDGTMSESVRAEAVSAFQSGRGDVFLVSLKAGGVGMNLTAADVVVLLDPWWNPAVEDQAAGRAHRIGQTRPVTVARIVTERTIEEKVLALHAKKRKLYDDVVADADGQGTLDVETIGALLSDDWSAAPAASVTPSRSEAASSTSE